MKAKEISLYETRWSQMGPAANEVCDEGRLVAQAKSGCSNAFGQLYERHRGKVYRTILQVVRQREDAEDGVQRCFQRAFMTLGRFRGDSQFSTWVTRIAINEALMVLRQRRAKKPLSEASRENAESSLALNLADAAPTPEERAEANELRGAVLKAISDLRMNLRIVILLREFHGLTNAETARRLGLTVTCVKARIFHARRWLRRRLERRPKLARNGSRIEELKRGERGSR
jgi:RNA polymerase sigma-70 factor, ECF subfamily